MKPECALEGCDRPSVNGFLCRADRHLLTQRLAELPALYEDLLITLTRQGKVGERSPGRSSESPLILDKDAADLCADLTRSLRWMVEHLVRLGEKAPCRCGHAHSQHYTVIPLTRLCWWRRCRCGGYRGAAVFSVRGMAAWLAYRVDKIVLDPDAGKILDALSLVSARIWSEIDQPEDLRSFPIGPCIQLDDKGVQCTGEIRAHIPHPKEGRAAEARCPVCGSVFEPKQWRNLGKRIQLRPRPAPRGIDPETGLLPPIPPGSAPGGRARLANAGDDNVAVAGRTTADHDRKLNEGLIS